MTNQKRQYMTLKVETKLTRFFFHFQGSVRIIELIQKSGPRGTQLSEVGSENDKKLYIKP